MTDLAVRDQAVLDLIQSQEEGLSNEDTFLTPILKLCQSTTQEVKAEEAEAGDFYNTLTGDDYGPTVNFVVAAFQRGRSASAPNGRYYVAIDTDVVPASWSDLVGEEFVGTRFDEHPDAEEQYRKRVNAKEIEWGKGPLISTTYNYTGLVLAPSVEGDDATPEWLPVRISFLRSTKKAHDKLMTLKKATMRNKGFWEETFEFASDEATFGRNTSFVINVRKVGTTPPEVQQQAVELAMAVRGGNVAANETADPEASVEPDAKGGLEV